MLNEKGFTLVEMVIVIVILGILAAIAIPQFKEYKERQQNGEQTGRTTRSESQSTDDVAVFKFKDGRSEVFAKSYACIDGILYMKFGQGSYSTVTEKIDRYGSVERCDDY